jgi:hypothetical protein
VPAVSSVGRVQSKGKLVRPARLAAELCLGRSECAVEMPRCVLFSYPLRSGG